MLDWNDLRHFLAVARAGSSAAAARALGTSQPTVVRRIAALEETVRLVLFDRHANGYRLTAHGEALRPEAEAVEQAIARFEAQASARARSGEQVIKLTVPEASVAALTPLLVEFRRRFPAVRVELRSDDAWLDLARGDADVAVRAGDYEEDERLFGHCYGGVGWALYASPGYIDARGVPASLAALADHAIIGADGRLAGARAFRWLEAHCGDAPVVWRGNVLSAVVSAIEAGLGIAPLPCAIGARHPGLEPVSRAIPELEGKMWVLTRRDIRLDPPVKLLMELIGDTLKATEARRSGATIRLRGDPPGPADAR